MAEVKVNQVVAEVEAGVQMKDKVTVVIIKWEKLMWWRWTRGWRRWLVLKRIDITIISPMQCKRLKSCLMELPVNIYIGIVARY